MPLYRSEPPSPCQCPHFQMVSWTELYVVRAPRILSNFLLLLCVSLVVALCVPKKQWMIPLEPVSPQVRHLGTTCAMASTVAGDLFLEHPLSCLLYTSDAADDWLVV